MGYLVLLATAAVPAYQAYDLWGRGSAPEKQVELNQFSPINPLKDLAPLGERVGLSLNVDGQTTSNLVISQALITNVGRAPIVPADYTRPLTVSVKRPWQIIAVTNANFFGPTVHLRWKRVDQTTFEAEPALLNPGDRVVTYVYATNTEGQPGIEEAASSKKFEVEWTQRIVNLRSFSRPQSAFDQMAKEYWGISVELHGWALPFTLGGALLFQAFYLYLLLQARFLSGWSGAAIAIVLATSLLSLAASESIATYLFGNALTRLRGVDHWANLPPIILHVLILCILYWRNRMLDKLPATLSAT